MTHLQLTQQDKDALFDYINGENDALVLDVPALNNYYYLMGWHETKAKLDRGEIISKIEEIASSESTDEGEF
ncbi:MAG TPA: hypothetical protein ACFCUY_12680 [Xenococcaceae cyanobacterium]